MVSGAVNDEFFFNVGAYDSDLECPATGSLGRAVSEWMSGLQDGFELNGTLIDAESPNQL